MPYLHCVSRQASAARHGRALRRGVCRFLEYCYNSLNKGSLRSSRVFPISYTSLQSPDLCNIVVDTRVLSTRCRQKNPVGDES